MAALAIGLAVAAGGVLLSILILAFTAGELKVFIQPNQPITLSSGESMSLPLLCVGFFVACSSYVAARRRPQEWLYIAGSLSTVWLLFIYGLIPAVFTVTVTGRFAAMVPAAVVLGLCFFGARLGHNVET